MYFIENMFFFRKKYTVFKLGGGKKCKRQRELYLSSGAAWLLHGNLRVQLGFGSGEAILLTQLSSSSAVAMGCSCKLGNGGAHQSQKNWLTTPFPFALCLCTPPVKIGRASCRERV